LVSFFRATVRASRDRKSGSRVTIRGVSVINVLSSLRITVAIIEDALGGRALRMLTNINYII